MGKTADDLTRLCDEMIAMRVERQDFVRGVTENERKAKAERQAFVSDLKEKVSDMRTEFATDIAATHQAWLLGSAKARDATR